jgi:cell cycle checkpoint control protein RAD9A
MVVLNFTLAPSGSSLLHDLLLCLSRFSDTVSFQARRENVSTSFSLDSSSFLLTQFYSMQLILSALNPSKSGHASFTLDQNFFSSYEFEPDSGRSDGRFTCAIANKVRVGHGYVFA